jgi:NADH dehydrogenase [ubiquinone] 1 alpha subcomplex assembly factor 7
MPTMSPLEAEIRRRIAETGPMPVGAYMALCLAHPQHGYYMGRDPFGARGDFVTAPEISQMFGELIGVWMAAVWRQMGAPARAHVVELGPGRGTLMQDALRAARVMAGFAEATAVHLVEISPVLRARQRETLREAGVPVHWHASFADVPPGPAIVVANEFFDALPVDQAVKAADGWHERRVGIDAQDRLAFVLAPSAIAGFERLLPARLRDVPPGAVFEWRAHDLAHALGRRLAEQGGAGLVIDYGHVESACGETLQAVARHAFADPLRTPGEADLTAHVDFEALMRAATSAGAKAFGPVAQGEFLRRLGIDARAAKLKANAPPKLAADVDSALARLTGSGRNEMGRLFKAVAFADPNIGIPPGFD